MMQQTLFHRAAAVVLVMLSLLPAVGRAADEKPVPLPSTADLRPRFVAGRTIRYDVWSLRKTSATMSVAGESKTTESVLETHGEITWRIDRVGADGSATCTMTFEWMTASSKATDEDEEQFDTRKPAGKPSVMDELLRSLAGVPLTVEMSADGTVTGVKGVDAFKNKFSQAAKRVLTEADRHAAAVERVPNELDFMETAADLAAITAAQDGLAPNRSWKSAADWNHEMGKLHHDTTYTVGSIEEVAGIPIATVSGVSKLRLDLDKSKFPALEGLKVDVRLKSGEAVSQVMFDLSRREAVGRNSVQTTSIEARLSREGQTLTHVTDETIQSQALRVSEK